MAYISTSSLEAVDAAHSFGSFDIELPPAATRWVRRLQELRTRRPEPPPRNRVAELIADGAPEADISAAIAQHVGQQHRLTQHSEAELLAGARALAAIMADRDRLHKELRVIAEQLIERLHTAAQIEESIVDLTRQRRTAEAHAVATADTQTATRVRFGSLDLSGHSEK